MAQNKTDQGCNFPLPAGTAKTIVPNGAQVVGGYGKKPIDDRWNPEHMLPRDPTSKR
jgi:hypothetical protein